MMTPSGRPKVIKVLIIDDDELIRMTCRNLLKKMSFSTFEAVNGNAGIALYKKEKPDLVITDMLMPDKEGLQTIIEIRALNQNAKIIAMSGGGETHNMTFLELAKKVGANNILGKPFKPDDFMRVIMETIGQ